MFVEPGCVTGVFASCSLPRDLTLPKVNAAHAARMLCGSPATRAAKTEASYAQDIESLRKTMSEDHLIGAAFVGR